MLARKLNRHLPGIALALFAAWAVFMTTMNDYYQYGATFYDSAQFCNLIWRSGIRLYLGPVFEGSIYTTHASTINYFPMLLSYLYPGERVDYYAMVYAALYAGSMLAFYGLLLPLCPWRSGPWMAAFGAFLVFCGQDMFAGSWEMRSDYAAPVCMVMMFRAWQQRRYRVCVLWLILTDMVREDLGIMIIVPLGLLGALQWFDGRTSDPALARERRRWCIRLCTLSLLWALVTIYIQKHFFPVYDLVADQYFNIHHPFAHLSYDLIEYRLWFWLDNLAGVWLPLVALAAAAVLFRDPQLLVGAVAFLPYVLGCFFAKIFLSGEFNSYKPFLLILPVLWPAVVALGRPQAMRRHYAILQCIVLACNMAYLRPWFFHDAYMRWVPQNMTHNIDAYRAFGYYGLKDYGPRDPGTYASHGVMALYPDEFRHYGNSAVSLVKPQDYGKVQTLLWFQGDRDQWVVDRILRSGTFTITHIPDTKISIARRQD